MINKENTQENSASVNLTSVKTRSDLAKFLNYTHQKFTYIAYGIPESKKYRQFEIPKKKGKQKRVIHAPNDKLKLMQSRISNAIQNTLKEQNQKQNLSHGFTKGKNIITNAKKHKNKRFILNIDIKNFFESISFYRIRGVLMKNNNLQLPYEVANTIAHIACREQKLPQGSPLSPTLSNLVGTILDSRLSKLARSHGCAYSRYADDITFSTNKKRFPTQIARPSEQDPKKWIAGNELSKIITKSGFEINESKTRMREKTERQEVTGLVVNQKINTTVEYRKNVRAYVHRLIKEGEFFIKQTDGEKITETKGKPSQLLGMLNHIIHTLRANRRNDTRKKINNDLHGIDRVFRDFIFYTRILKSKNPLIICEGHTDVVYIKSAMSSMPKTIKSISIQEQSTSLTFWNHRKHNKNTINNIIGLQSGGTGNIGELMKKYHSFHNKVINTNRAKLKQQVLSKKQEPTNPVIFIVDRDDAGSKVFSVAKDLAKERLKSVNFIENTDPFFYIFGNVYLITIPKTSRPINDIESLLPDVLRENHVGNDGIVKDKKLLAEIVAKRRDASLFEGFTPLLHAIDACITHYRNEVTPKFHHQEE